MGYLREEDYNIAPPAPYGADGASGAAGAAGSAAMMSNPAMAGLSMGGSLISGYMAQKAKEQMDIRNKKAQIAQNQADGEISSMKFLDNVYKGALL